MCPGEKGKAVQQDDRVLAMRDVEAGAVQNGVDGRGIEEMEEEEDEEVDELLPSDDESE